MLTRPALSLNIKDLKDIEGQPIAENTHNVNMVTFIDKDGTVKRAYKKSCTADTYPPILAKYVVAFSTLVRAALGERASEDRLVYNDAGEIVATISIEVPNFVPLLTLLNKYDNPEKEKMGNPDKQMLIEKNVAELLISAYKHKNHDLHPANMSVNGLIDWDELYPVSHIIKGEPITSGLLYTSPLSCEYKEQDLRIFPIVYRRHWPANYIPKNWNIKKIYKTGAFAELRGDKDFIYQYFTAILKELLAFDKNMLKERMYLYLGNEGLSLDDLSPQKRAELLRFGQDGKLFFDENGKERSFIDHAMLFLEQEHIKFRNVVLNMPEFKDFLVRLNKEPEKILELQKWFNSQNKKNSVPYNLNFIDIELHTLWYECFKQKFTDHMKLFDVDIKQWLKTSPLNKKNQDMSYEQLTAILNAFIKPEEKPKSFILSNRPIEPEEALPLSNGIFSKIKGQATDLFENISQLIDQYKEKKDATIEDNHIFIENVKKAIAKNLEERNQLNTWLQNYRTKSAITRKELYFILNDHIKNMAVLCHYVDKFIKKTEHMLDNFYMNPPIVPLLPLVTNKNADNPEFKTMSYSNQAVTPNEAKNSSFLALVKPYNTDDLHYIHTETTIIQHLSAHLKEWITPDRNAIIKEIIRDVYTHDYDARNSHILVVGTFYNFFRNKGEEVYHMTLDEIFSDPNSKWNPTSFKTLLIKKLCFKLLEIEKYDPYMKSIYNRISKYDDTWWSTVAKEIAEKSNLLKTTGFRISERAGIY